MEFRILGSFDVVDDGRSLALGGPRQRALLAFLLLHRNEAVPTERLVAELWGEAPPRTAAKTIHVYASRLRRELGDGILERRPAGYVLTVDPDAVDAERFERLVEAAGRNGPEAAAQALREALSLWRGEPLADLQYEPFARLEIARLEERRLHAIEERIEADLALGRHAEVVGELERLVAEQPFRERLIGQLMLALYRSGRQADALTAYRDTRRRLHDELGLDPTPSLRRLEKQILAHDPELELRPHSRRTVATGAVGAGGRPARAKGRRLGPAFVAAAIAAVVVAGAAAVAAVLVRGSDGLRRLDANTVGGVDAEGAIAAQIRPSLRPGAIASGGGYLWVAGEGDGKVARIDPKTRAVDTLVVGGTVSGIAFGAGSLWVSRGDERSVVQIDPAELTPVQSFPVGNAPGALVVDEEAVWVANAIDGTVSRIGLDRGAVTKTIPACANPSAIAEGAGGVWLACEAEGRVLRIDPRSQEVVHPVNVGNGPAGLAFGEGAVWVANRADGTVSRIDPARGSVSEVLPVGRSPTSVATGLGSVWVTEAAGTIARIDPRTHDVADRVTLGSSPTAATVAAGRLWVTTSPALRSHRGGVLRIESGPLLCRCVDPAGPGDPTEMMAGSLLWDTLLAYRRVGGSGGRALVGDLATGVPAPASGGTAYTLRLQGGVRFSNGAPVRAADVRYSLERLLTMSPEARGYYGIVGETRCSARPPQRCDLSRGIEVDDESGRITVRLDRPDPDFLYKLTLPAIVPAGTPLRPARTRQIPSTGPYRVAAVGRDDVRLVRNEHFRVWSPDARPDGYPDEIRFHLTEDEEARVRAVERGRADLATQVPAGRLAGLLTRYPGRLHRGATPATDYMFLNTRVPPLDDVRVRRALNYAVDRRRIAELVGAPLTATVTCQLLPAGVPGYRPWCRYTVRPNAAGTWTAPDLRRARKLVAASGTGGMRVQVFAYDLLGRPAYARYFVRLLRRLGYRSSLRIIPQLVPDYLQYVGNPGNRAQIGTLGWTLDFAAPSNFLQGLFSCASFRPHGPENLNLSEFCDLRIDAQMERASALQASDPVRANALWARADRALTARAAAVPLVNRHAVTFVSERVGNFQTHVGRGTLLDQLWVR